MLTHWSPLLARAVIWFLLGIFAVVGLIAIAARAPVQAHSFYPPECCQDKDCRPIPESEVRELAWDRILDLVSGYEIGGSKIRQSPDGGWHICNAGANRINRPICIFRPVPAF